MIKTSLPVVLAFTALLGASVAACGGSDDASSGGEPASTEDVCASAKSVGDAFDAGDAATNDAELIAALGELDSVLDDFVAKAPDEIEDDATIVAEQTKKFVTALSDAGNDAESADLSFMEEDGFAERSEKAADNIDVWTQENCGFTIGD